MGLTQDIISIFISAFSLTVIPPPPPASAFNVLYCLYVCKGEFPVMEETTRKLAASTRCQFFFVASTTASTRCLVQNFQLICYSQRVNATSQYNNVAVRDVQNGRTGWDRCSGEILLAPCTRKKRLQRKITEHYHWIGVQENIGMFSKS